jgi:phosphopantetheinyl transferase (holo-ACP synthase)
LVAVSIEGVSDAESIHHNGPSGEEVIDVAEYYGSEELSKSRKVIYLQLKHSSTQLDKPWVLSGLEKTLVGFFKRFQAYSDEVPDPAKQQVEFVFLTNRPVANWVHSLFQRISERRLESSDDKKWQQLKKYLSASDQDIYRFLENFRIEDTADGYWEQRNILFEELAGYLPGADRDGADQLWLLVTKKALPESAKNHSIRKEDVLRALKTDEEHLFPAPCLIEAVEGLLPREQEHDFIQSILGNTGQPIIIHADGGVGKSAIARRIAVELQSRAAVVLYDCFGNGAYRSAISPRHTHDVGLTQIANELASQGLCHPMIPSQLAKPADYLKAFDLRLRQACSIMSSRDPEAKIVILVDAADNAQMAAVECGDQTSFPRDLLRHEFPEGVVLVCLSRTHRVDDHLSPPLDYVDLQLQPFSETETRRFLLGAYRAATDEDVIEFHRLSSMNPRVQATVLETTSSLPEALEALGPVVTTVEDTIRNLFERSIARLKDQSPKAEAAQIQTFCEALAALRPFVPIKVLSLASNLPVEAIRSFIADIGRPLAVRSDAVQFIDEPSDTWFREKFKPQQNDLSTILAKLRPLASTNSYVASALPQLMMEAGDYDELIELVLSEEALPTANPAERRQVALYRLQFALKAALRRRRLKDAAKLALKAGSETAGEGRQQQLFQDNTDLVAQFLSDDQLRETVANNGFSTGWHGGHRAYEAGLLAGRPGTISDSRNTLRVAQKWLRNWSQLDREARREEEISDSDIAELAWCTLNIAGPDAFVAELERWTPKEVAFRAGLIVAKKLVDLGRFELLDRISVSASNNLCILFAIIEAESLVQRFPPKEAVLRAVQGLASAPRRLKKLENIHDWKQTLLSVANSVAMAAAHYQAIPNKEISVALDHYIPKPEKAYFSRFSSEPKSTIVAANCIRARLAGQPIALEDIAKPEIREELAKGGHVYERETREFLDEVGPVFHWYDLWVRVQLGQVAVENLDAEIEQCLKEYNKNLEYRERDRRHIAGEVAFLWVQIIARFDNPGQRFQRFKEWKTGLKRQLFTPGLCKLARLCANSKSLKSHAVCFADEAAEIIRTERMEAEQKVDGYCEISRSIFVLNSEEANCYFDLAVEVAGRIGQEHLDYWTAIIELATKAAIPGTPRPDLAYRVSRAAEVIYDYVARDKYFDWSGTVEAIASLSPSSTFAILSRWRDRNFGWQDRIRPIAASKLVELGEISSRSSLAFCGFQHNSNTVDMLEAALTDCDDVDLAHTSFKLAVRYTLVEGASVSELEAFEGIARQNGWNVEGIERQRYFRERVERRKNDSSRYAGSIENPTEREAKDWDTIFSGLDVASPTTVSNCYKEFRSGEPPYYFSKFASEFFERCPTGKEAVSLRTIFSLENMSLYEIRGTLESLPESWKSLRSVKRAMSDIVNAFCRSHFHEISKSRYYQPLPLEEITRITGISSEEVYGVVVDECAQHPDLFGSERLFTLVSLIASQISPEEAQDVLQFGITLLEEEMEESDGDGKWRPELEPPSDPIETVAGYIWTCLAAPEVSWRWQAAHVVCLLSDFGETECLRALAKYAVGHNAKAFSDSSLPFYGYAAKQWLLIAILRTLKNGRSIPREMIEFLRVSCQKGEKHALIRSIAAQCILALFGTGIVELDEAERSRLESINHSEFPPLPERPQNTNQGGSSDSEVQDDDRYYFGLDMPQYWFSPLGGVFGLPSREIERRALAVIRHKWNLATRGAWTEDPRGKLGLYQGTDSHHSHGSYPRTESLSFYHSYNAMMIVAGELIDSEPTLEQPEYYDRLEDWLQRHWITRNDGKWLADRRDFKPPKWPDWKDTEETDDWPFSVSKEDLLNQIDDQHSSIPVWGSWNEVAGDREQSVRISSALVSAQTSGSLLRALQTVQNPMDYRIPTASDEMEIDAGPFKLIGWISESSREFGIDEFDPWAGEIQFPPLRPASWLCNRFGLSCDPERRVWRTSTERDSVDFRSLNWGRREEDREYHTPEVGERLELSKPTLLAWLSELELDLIVEVQLRREFRRGSYRKRETSIGEYAPPYTLILLIKSDGTVETI